MVEKNLNEIATVKPFFNSSNLPPKYVFCSKNPSKTQISPLDALSPQDVLDKHGMYRQESVYSKNPQKIYTDLSEFGDYESNLNAVCRMREKFNALSPEIRSRFNNSVSEFTSAVTSPDFNVEKVLTDKEVESLRRYKDDLRAKEEFEAYKKTPEYLKNLEESKLRMQFDKEQFENWKNSRKNSKQN